MTTSALLPQLERDEGLRLEAYPDPGSPLAAQLKLPLADRVRWWKGLSGAPWTIGYGHTGREVHPGLIWTQSTASAALQADVAATEQGLDSALPWWRTLDDVRQDAVANQAFNMGVHKLMSFTTYLDLLKAHEFVAAANDDLNTLWARQVGDRATRIAAEIRTGQLAA